MFGKHKPEIAMWSLQFVITIAGELKTKKMKAVRHECPMWQESQEAWNCFSFFKELFELKCALLIHFANLSRFTN